MLPSKERVFSNTGQMGFSRTAAAIELAAAVTSGALVSSVSSEYGKSSELVAVHALVGAAFGYFIGRFMTTAFAESRISIKRLIMAIGEPFKDIAT